MEFVIGVVTVFSVAAPVALYLKWPVFGRGGDREDDRRISTLKTLVLGGTVCSATAFLPILLSFREAKENNVYIIVFFALQSAALFCLSKAAISRVNQQSNVVFLLANTRTELVKKYFDGIRGSILLLFLISLGYLVVALVKRVDDSPHNQAETMLMCSFVITTSAFSNVFSLPLFMATTLGDLFPLQDDPTNRTKANALTKNVYLMLKYILILSLAQTIDEEDYYLTLMRATASIIHLAEIIYILYRAHRNANPIQHPPRPSLVRYSATSTGSAALEIS